MERKYPTKMFWFFVITTFLVHFFYLSIPGIILCIIGIWVKSCLWIGLVILGLDVVLSIIEQLRIRRAALRTSNNPEFNELMDAFCSPGGLEAFGKVWNGKNKSGPATEPQEDEV